jgi:hypothetical protein
MGESARVLRAVVIVVLVASFSGALAGAGDPSPREAPVVLPSKDLGIGRRVEDLSFVDLDGKAGRLSDWRDRKAVVICLTSTTCPVARKYGPTLVRLAVEFQGRGVEFLAVNVSESEVERAMREALAAARAAGYRGRYVADRGQKLGKALGARSTTEVFVLDRARTLVYRGAVDDQFGLGYAIESPRANYLRNALEAVLNDDRPAVEATTAPGCVLELGDRPASSAAPITYHNRISRIVQNNCAECHRAGEPAPFTLTSYADVKDHGAMIKKVVGKNIMPPWFGRSEVSAFHNDRSLSLSDKADLVGWIESGAPEGDPADAPVARRWATGWRIGQPDMIAQVPQAQNVPASGTIPYRYASVKTNLEEDRWVQAMEIRPSAPQVVHHILVFVELPRTDPRRAQFRGHRGGTNGYFAGMVPGQGHIVFPEGTSKLLPKGATLVFQIHYTTNGQAAQDRPRIGFKFAKGKPEHEVVTAATSNRFFEIPAGADDHAIAASHTFFQPVRLLSVNPHAHVRGKAFKYELIRPDGTSQVLLDVPHYDFNWQLEYQFTTPVDVPAGSRLLVTGWYDNSRANPANPDPTKAIRWGDQTWEEMMIGYFTGYVVNKGQ